MTTMLWLCPSTLVGEPDVDIRETPTGALGEEEERTDRGGEWGEGVLDRVPVGEVWKGTLVGRDSPAATLLLVVGDLRLDFLIVDESLTAAKTTSRDSYKTSNVQTQHHTF